MDDMHENPSIFSQWNELKLEGCCEILYAFLIFDEARRSFSETPKKGRFHETHQYPRTNFEHSVSSTES